MLDAPATGQFESIDRFAVRSLGIEECVPRKMTVVDRSLEMPVDGCGGF
jgi:hypothetical protein